MASGRPVLLDDRLLIGELLHGVPHGRRPLVTSSSWYFRACRAAVAGGGGQLSGPFAEVAVGLQERAILSLLELRDVV
ncbi:MAG TPA: hypothetical protein VGO60_07950 [Iamia sp.]|nr:hypothetical protein [Iamia sp.]